MPFQFILLSILIGVVIAIVLSRAIKKPASRSYDSDETLIALKPDYLPSSIPGGSTYQILPEPQETELVVNPDEFAPKATDIYRKAPQNPGK